jgi:hypothetical protein
MHYNDYKEFACSVPRNGYHIILLTFSSCSSTGIAASQLAGYSGKLYYYILIKKKIRRRIK